MKPLASGRKVLIWLGVHFVDDKPVSWQQKLAQKSCSVAVAIIFIIITIFQVRTFMRVQFINKEEFFYVLLYVVFLIQSGSSFITIYLYGSNIETVFQSLTQIYEKCKRNRELTYFSLEGKNSQSLKLNSISRSRQTFDRA